MCAPVVDPKVRSVEGAAEEGPRLEEERRGRREAVQGEPLSEAERKVLVEKCQRGKTKKQINLGNLGFFGFGFSMSLFDNVGSSNFV